MSTPRPADVDLLVPYASMTDALITYGPVEAFAAFEKTLQAQ